MLDNQGIVNRNRSKIQSFPQVQLPNGCHMHVILMISFQLIPFNTQFQKFADPTGTSNLTFFLCPSPPWCPPLSSPALNFTVSTPSRTPLTRCPICLLGSSGKVWPWLTVTVHPLSPGRLNVTEKIHNPLTSLTLWPWIQVGS